MRSIKNPSIVLIVAAMTVLWSMPKVHADDDSSRNILKQGLLGAGTGAIAASASGGKAGKGALIGAGTNIIGGALLDTLTGPSQPQQQPQQVVYVQQQPQYVQSYSAPQQGGYYPAESQPVYVQQAPAYEPPPQEDPNKKILKQGLLGAGTGAIAAGASGGNAGKGALIGAGTNVIGGALLDTLTTPSQPQRPQTVYVQQAPPPPQYQQYPAQYSNQNQGYVNQSSSTTSQPKKKIIRKYDSDGNVISEEEVWE